MARVAVAPRVGLDQDDAERFLEPRGKPRAVLVPWGCDQVPGEREQPADVHFGVLGYAGPAALAPGDQALQLAKALEAAPGDVFMDGLPGDVPADDLAPFPAAEELPLGAAMGLPWEGEGDPIPRPHFPAGEFRWLDLDLALHRARSRLQVQEGQGRGKRHHPILALDLGHQIEGQEGQREQGHGGLAPHGGVGQERRPHPCHGGLRKAGSRVDAAVRVDDAGSGLERPAPRARPGTRSAHPDGLEGAGGALSEGGTGAGCGPRRRSGPAPDIRGPAPGGPGVDARRTWIPPFAGSGAPQSCGPGGQGSVIGFRAGPPPGPLAAILGR